jgi:hypothetical protein
MALILTEIIIGNFFKAPFGGFRGLLSLISPPFGSIFAGH